MEHQGHRQRLRERFFKDSLSSFQSHEILELILMYAIPRRDTNLLAHRLIEEFGSLNRVLEADLQELTRVEGIGEYAASLIMLFLPVMKAYEKGKLHEKTVIRNTRDLKNFCRHLFIGASEEKFYVISLNAQMQVIAADLICEGTPSQVGVSLRSVISVLLKRNGTGAVLVHNHPSGCAIPSQQDVDMTEEIASMLSAMDIRVYDHLVVTDKEISSMKEMGLLLESSFLENNSTVAAERPMAMKPRVIKKE